MIRVLGLGPGDPGLLTERAVAILREEVLAGTSSLVLRTRIHPTVARLEEWGVPFESHDAFYETGATFDEVYRAIHQDLIARAARGPLVYAVPGNPLVGERTVRDLLSQHEVAIELVPGMSALDVMWGAMGADPILGMRMVDALDLVEWDESADRPFRPALRLDPTVATTVLHVYAPRIASAAKLPLLERYPAEHPVTVLRAAGVPGEQRIEIHPLHAIDRLPWIDHLTSLYLPPAPPRGVARLVDLVAHLRSPAGCPWDREQTPLTLVKYVLEEAYEAVEAIEAGDPEHIEEELGDLLLQVVLQSQLAREAGDFDLEDVADGIADKLVRRHPHVFGSTEAATPGAGGERWDELKAKEKGRPPAGILAGISSRRSALSWADALNRKAARAGFEWADFAGVLAKVVEEAGELEEAREEGDRPHIIHELGDLLLAVTNLARWLDVDPEEALRKANRRFVARFTELERLAGGELAGLTLDRMLALWREAKERVG